MHDRIIGALELCCRLGEMLLIQNKRVDWDTHTIGIPGHTTKDKENRRIPFDPNGRLAAVLQRRGKLGPNAFVFGTDDGDYVASFKTAWESLLLIANGHDTKRAKHGARVDRAKLQQIDLHWHDLRHEGACRLLADGVDIRIIQLMLGHASVQQTQRYLNVTDEELRKGLEVSWRRRTLKDGRGRPECVTKCHTCVTRSPFSGSPPRSNGRSRQRAKVQSQQRLAAARRLARPAGLEPATPGLEGQF